MRNSGYKRGNLYAGVPAELPVEWMENLVESRGDFRVERIVSRGHDSPPGFWYEQDTSEWVVLLKGEADLCFEEGEDRVNLTPGDWLEIPSGCRHRVESTAPGEDTVWLAIHWKEKGKA